MGIMSRYIGVGFRDRHSRFEAPDSVISEPSQLLLIAIERKRRQDVEVLINDSETARHDADDLTRLGINHDRASDDGMIAAEATLPVSVAEHDPLWAIRDLIRGRQLHARECGNAERLEHAVSDEYDVHFFGPRQPSHVRLVCDPYPQRFKGPNVSLAEGEVHGCGEWQAVLKAGQAGCSGRIEPQGNKSARVGIGEWLQKHAIDDTEDRCIGADSDRKREKYRSGETRRLCQSAQGEFQIVKGD